MSRISPDWVLNILLICHSVLDWVLDVSWIWTQSLVVPFFGQSSNLEGTELRRSILDIHLYTETLLSAIGLSSGIKATVLEH